MFLLKDDYGACHAVLRRKLRRNGRRKEERRMDYEPLTCLFECCFRIPIRSVLPQRRGLCRWVREKVGFRWLLRTDRWHRRSPTEESEPRESLPRVTLQQRENSARLLRSVYRDVAGSRDKGTSTFLGEQVSDEQKGSSRSSSFAHSRILVDHSITTTTQKVCSQRLYANSTTCPTKIGARHPLSSLWLHQ